jgi:hypothetical protein
MIRDFMEGLRHGRDAARAESERKRSDAPTPETTDTPPREEEWVEARVDDLDERELGDREDEGEKNRRIIAELADALETLQAHNTDLEAMVELFGAVLSLPDVEIGLKKRFHPDTHPKASAAQCEALTAMTQSINAAYDAIRRRHAADGA